jgi:hypothetical protein
MASDYPFWRLLAIVSSGLWFTASDYPLYYLVVFVAGLFSSIKSKEHSPIIYRSNEEGNITL